jgi:hypothetical protein
MGLGRGFLRFSRRILHILFCWVLIFRKILNVGFLEVLKLCKILKVVGISHSVFVRLGDGVSQGTQRAQRRRWRTGLATNENE